MSIFRQNAPPGETGAAAEDAEGRHHGRIDIILVFSCVERLNMQEDVFSKIMWKLLKF